MVIHLAMKVMVVAIAKKATLYAIGRVSAALTQDLK